MKNQTRLGKKKKSKKKFFLSIFLIIFIFFSAVSLYFYWQYKQGLEASQKEVQATDEEIEFNGVEDELDRVNILLLGSDSRGEENPRTDTIMIAQYDPDTKQSKIASIMRDSYVEIPGYKKNKINVAYSLGGAELLRETIKHNFDIDVQYYAIVDFTGFTKMIDEGFPEGIEINVEKEMSEGIDVTLEPGIQKLNGEELLGYVRFRQDINSDFGRVARQQEVMKKLASEMVSIGGVVKIPKMLGTIKPYISTNIKNKEILSLATSILSNDTQNIETLRIPLDGTFTDERYDGVGLVLDIQLEENRQALKEFIN